MKRLLTLAALLFATIAVAELVNVSATGGGRYSCRVDGAEISSHTSEYKASAAAINLKLENPNSSVICSQDRSLIAILTSAGRQLLEDAGAAVVVVEPSPATDQPPVVSSTPNPSFTEGSSSTYSFSDDVTDDGLSSVSYSLTNTLAAGLSLASSTGVLSYDGVGVASSNSHQMTATDAVGSDQSSAFNIFVTTPSVGAQADFDFRSAGPAVVWWHDFATVDEVDAFRWSLSIGNDPNDGVGTRDQNTVEWNSTDGITPGALELTRNAGTNDGKDWWRPMSPMSSPGNGKAAADPAASGTISVETWNPIQGGNQTAGWGAPGGYGPDSTGSWDGRTYYLQMAMKLDSRRRDASFGGGKIIYLTRTDVSLTAQELVTYYKNSTTYSIYKAGSPEIPSNLANVPHVWDVWAHYLYKVTPGDENVGETGVEVWRVLSGETSYTKIFETFVESIDYNDAFNKAWNALIVSIYHNGANLPEFNQSYDQIIFSKDVVLPPGTASSDIGAACMSLSSGASAGFSAGNQSSLAESEIEWNTSMFHDPYTGRIHMLGKAAGLSDAWRHQYYDIATGAWTTVTTSFSGGVSRFGHIYGNSAFDEVTGDLYQVGGDVIPQANRFAWRYRASTGLWDSRMPTGSTVFGTGAWNDTANGVAIHPHLYGWNEPGLIVDQQISMHFVNLQTNAVQETPHSSNAYGQREGDAVYWPAQNVVIIGGAPSSANLAQVSPNGGGTPIITNLPNPPINLAGLSQQNSSNFGSLHVHPGNPDKLLILETTGQRAWTSVDGSTWVQISNHPFTQNARVVAPLRGELNCMWAVGNDNGTNFSELWRPAP
jgi:hypothetical protein